MSGLIERVATRAGVSQAAARRLLKAFADEALVDLVAGEDVNVPGLGAIEARWVSERTVRSVRDGRRTAVDGHFRPAFRASARLRDALRGRTPQLLKDPAHQKAWRVAETLIGDLSLYHGISAPHFVADDSLELVDSRCAAAFGAAWGRVRRTYEEQIPAATRAERDHLALAARRRWSERE
jgi:nucleoid DNA-binding protein